MKRIFVAAVATALALSACTTDIDGLTTLDPATIENGIDDWLIENDVVAEPVDCPDSMRGKTGDSWLCTVVDELGMTYNIEVTMTSSDGFVEWVILP